MSESKAIEFERHGETRVVCLAQRDIFTGRWSHPVLATESDLLAAGYVPRSDLTAALARVTELEGERDLARAAYRAAEEQLGEVTAERDALLELERCARSKGGTNPVPMGVFYALRKLDALRSTTVIDSKGPINEVSAKDPRAAGEEKPPGFHELRAFTDDSGTLSLGLGGFTTVRVCRHCGVLIAGGPTVCLTCANKADPTPAAPAESGGEAEPTVVKVTIGGREVVFSSDPNAGERQLYTDTRSWQLTEPPSDAPITRAELRRVIEAGLDLVAGRDPSASGFRAMLVELK
jgi:hypothetical protein